MSRSRRFPTGVSWVVRGIVLACVLGAGGEVMASEQERPQPPPDLFTRRIVYSVPGMDRVQAIRDRVYARPGGQELRMDVYVPAGLDVGAKRPAVVFIHGG